ncbi:MAG TPA: hypothetical protein VNK52_16240 [Hyphomicrobiaceae bacterium]|nr:hypothetical protein [Hyphomicrobiaceae bacterium]
MTVYETASAVYETASAHVDDLIDEIDRLSSRAQQLASRAHALRASGSDDPMTDEWKAVTLMRAEAYQEFCDALVNNWSIIREALVDRQQKLTVPTTIYDAVERVLDEHSAWIARPNPNVTKAVALAAGIAWSLHDSTATDAPYEAGFRDALAIAGKKIDDAIKASTHDSPTMRTVTNWLTDLYGDIVSVPLPMRNGD